MEKLFPMEGIFEISSQNGFHLPENQFPLARMNDLLKNKFTLDEKALTKNGKKWFLLARKSVSTSRNKVIFQKLDLPVSANRKKTLNKRILFQLDRKSVSTSGNGELFKNTLLLNGKPASIDRNIQKIQENGCQ